MVKNYLKICRRKKYFINVFYLQIFRALFQCKTSMEIPRFKINDSNSLLNSAIFFYQGFLLRPLDPLPPAREYSYIYLQIA